MFFLVLYFIPMLLPAECTLNITIHDYVKDWDMVDPCRSTNYTEYCKYIGACEPGTHVMCMYYKSGMVMGPHCESGNMFRITQELRNVILNSIKVLRDEVSAGKARGKDDVLLPRAYNLRRRLLWDRDLSTFAQVWANQCRMTHDFCRATQLFKDPGQFVGVDIFTHPEWQSLKPQNKLKEMEKHCLTPSKVKEAIQAIIKLLKDEAKEITTGDMIDDYPGGPRNNYLMMLNANATHIGCGMAYYQGYKWISDLQKHDVFVLELVCNLSHRPIIGHAVYNTTRPLDFVEPTEPPTTTEATTVVETTGLRDLVPGGRGPGVLIMPIITVEDAPTGLSLQRPTVLRKAIPSTYNMYDIQKQSTKIAPSPRKSSIFARVPIFNLSSRNHGKTSNENLQEKASLKNKLKTLIEQVPSREIPRLRELLKQIIKKQKSEENQIANVGPIENLSSVVSKAQEIVSGKSNHDPSIVVNDEGEDELLRLTKGKFKEIKHGNDRHFTGSELANYADNPDIVQIKDENRNLDPQSQFHIPLIRKQKPIVHGKENSKPRDNYHEKTLVDGYNTAVEKQENYNLDKNNIAIIDHNQDKTNFGNNVASKTIHFAGGNKMNGHQLMTPDTKLKRRLYLENEISKLKRKLQHLRQYIRDNDVNENTVLRPVVTSHDGQRTTKFDERRNFYMPDRAHPLHEYK